MNRHLRCALPALLLPLAIALPACAEPTDDTEITVRSSTTDGPLTQAELELGDAVRHVLVLERDDGERAIAVFDGAIRLRAIARSEGNAWIAFDPEVGLDSPVECTGACAPIDAVSLEVIASVIEDRVDLTVAADVWRQLASGAQKKLDAHRDSLANNMAG